MITNENYKSLIETHIRQQGNQVDLGSVLPLILGESLNAVEIKTEELRTMRDNGELITGAWYRVTDYEFTTMQENTRSAGHKFDILVMATSPTTLSEDARAIQHEGETHFEGQNLNAWRLRYTLDNVKWSRVRGVQVYDTDSEYWFVAAGETEINGVRMYLFYNADFEYDDDVRGYYATTHAVPNVGDDLDVYDINTNTIVEYGYASVQGVRNYDEDGFGTILWLKDENNNECYYDFKNAQFLRGYDDEKQSWSVTDDIEDGKYFYTFSTLDDNDVVADASALDGVYCNRIGYYSEMNNNILIGEYNYSNTFGNYCFRNTFGNYCQYNTFGNDCQYNSFGNGCSSNTFGNNCQYNTFGNNCQYNTFGNDVQVTHSGTIVNITHSGTIAIVTHSGTIAIITHSGTDVQVTHSGTIAIITHSGTIVNITHSGTIVNITHSGTIAIVTHSGTDVQVTHSGTMCDNLLFLKELPISQLWVNLAHLMCRMHRFSMVHLEHHQVA